PSSRNKPARCDGTLDAARGETAKGHPFPSGYDRGSEKVSQFIVIGKSRKDAQRGSFRSNGAIFREKQHFRFPVPSPVMGFSCPCARHLVNLPPAVAQPGGFGDRLTVAHPREGALPHALPDRPLLRLALPGHSLKLFRLRSPHPAAPA